MKLTKKFSDPTLAGLNTLKVFKRTTARGILIDGDEILLIYTKQYDDYSFPGGGVDDEEALEEGLRRELAEETGAQNVHVVAPFGKVEEIRPIHYPDYEAMHQTSYFFRCTCDRELGEATPEAYEVQNGSVAVWVDLGEAIAHNRRVIEENPEHIGLSIHRETWVLERILEEQLRENTG
jgi:ADP-ribose pyrophosphatase YjhB (NUDIX family)